MREAANAEVLENGRERLILSIALPGGPFHGDYFLIPKLAPHVDWFNIMAYNLHGQWEKQVFCAAPLHDPAAKTEYNGYSLIHAIESMAPKTVSPQKFNLGLSLSGVTFTLKDKSLTEPGAPAQGPGNKGCQEQGAMSYFEATKLMDLLGAKSQAVDVYQRKITQAPKLDEQSQCMYMVVNEDQWVGFDTPETFAYKVDYFHNFGFGGVSIWSMDSDTKDHRLTRSIFETIHGKGNKTVTSGPNNTGKVVDRLPGADRPKSISKNAAGTGLDAISFVFTTAAAIALVSTISALLA
ncbi:hypothetical protein BGZ96_011868 [Linnemannia gamsii]|uniref:GH18 domain-containing protein n=1 Tax=Linnemannia gamsii TaxID=64522 RepID=A0ABQ7JS33_9FUNG|nr:hypothetical protein BGZ96_011868 [Linnemannia gamsii]